MPSSREKFHSIHTGLRGVAAVGRAAFICTSRKLDEEAWHPSEACVGRAQEAADKIGPLVTDNVTERERSILWAADIDVE